MVRSFLVVLLALAACSSPTGSNNNGGDDVGPDNVGSDGGPNNSTNGTPNGQTTPTNVVSGACGDLNEPFKEAVRAMPRDCVTDADCKIVPRAQVCDCDLAVSATSDTADHDAVRADLDANACPNPFGCATEECPYVRLSNPGELYAHCNELNECEIVQIMSCVEFEMKASGGIVQPGGCMNNGGCTLRADLNPCGCSEAVSTNFPVLALEPLGQMMDINEARCNLQCMGCSSPGGAVCGDDGAGNMVCMTQ